MPYNYYQPYNYDTSAQVRRLQQMQSEISEQLAAIQQQPMPQIQQNFIAATPNAQHAEIPSKWVNSYDEVKTLQVYTATIFMDRNQPKFYIKDETGAIKSYQFEEIQELDEKDMKILELENKIRELERGNSNEQSVNEYDEQQTTGQSATTTTTRATKTK